MPRFLEALGRRRLLVALVLVLVPVLSVLLHSTHPPVYRANADVLIADRDLSSVVAGVVNPDSGVQDVATEVQIAALPSILAAAKRSVVGVPGSLVREARGRVRILTTQNTARESNILSVEADSSDRVYAERLATETAQRYVDFRAEVAARETRIARDAFVRRREQALREGAAVGDAAIQLLDARIQRLDTLLILGFSPASLVEEARGARTITPQPAKALAVGLALGVVLAALAVVVADGLDRRPRTPRLVGEMLSAPVLGQLPRVRETRLFAQEEAGAAEWHAEEIRRVWNDVRMALAAAGGRSLLVTTGDATRTGVVSGDLAAAAALAGHDVVHIDLAPGDPVAAGSSGRRDSPGLADVAGGAAPIEAALTEVELGKNRVPGGRLRVSLPGAPRPAPGALVGSPQMLRELERLASRMTSGYVVVAAPPITLDGAADLLAAVISATVLVVDMRSTSDRSLRELGIAMEAGPHNLLGVVTLGGGATAGRGRFRRTRPRPAGGEAAGGVR